MLATNLTLSQINAKLANFHELDFEFFSSGTERLFLVGRTQKNEKKSSKPSIVLQK